MGVSGAIHALFCVKNRIFDFKVLKCGVRGSNVERKGEKGHLCPISYCLAFWQEGLKGNAN